MFDSYDGSVFNHGSEIWGFHNGKDVEKVQVQYLKSLLGVKSTTNCAVVHCETGRFPMKIVRLNFYVLILVVPKPILCFIHLL